MPHEQLALLHAPPGAAALTPDRKQPSFQQLVEAVSDFAIYMLDPDGRVMSWNPAAERIKGWRREEVEGQSFRRFFTLEDQRAGLPERILARAREQGRAERSSFDAPPAPHPTLEARE